MLIIGTGGFASDVLGTIVIENSVVNIALYNDIGENDCEVYKKDFQIITKLSDAETYFKEVDNRFIICVGDNRIRESLSKKFIAIGGINSSFISKRAYVGSNAKVSETGVIIMQFSSISNTARVDEGTIVYLNSGVGHNSRIGKYCLISASVFMSKVSIGEYSNIGIGVNFKPGVSLGKRCTVGTGSVVTKSFEDDSIIMGNPGALK